MYNFALGNGDSNTKLYNAYSLINNSPLRPAYLIPNKSALDLFKLLYLHHIQIYLCISYIYLHLNQYDTFFQ